ARPAYRCKIFQDDFEKIVDGALLDDQAAVHVGLPDGEHGVEREPNLRPFVGDTRHNRRTTMVSEAIVAIVGVDQVEIACRDKPVEDIAERAEHRSTNSEPGPPTRGLRKTRKSPHLRKLRRATQSSASRVP